MRYRKDGTINLCASFETSNWSQKAKAMAFLQKVESFQLIRSRQVAALALAIAWTLTDKIYSGSSGGFAGKPTQLRHCVPS